MCRHSVENKSICGRQVFVPASSVSDECFALCPIRAGDMATKSGATTRISIPMAQRVFTFSTSLYAFQLNIYMHEMCCALER